MNLVSGLAAYGANNKARVPFRLLFDRGFSQKSAVKALVIYEQNNISFSQVYPFIYYRRAFAERYGVEFRFVGSESAIGRILPEHREATHVLAQTWLTDPPDRLPALCRRLRALPRSPRLVYLDSFANTDIRLAHELDGFSLYYKKSLFVERDRFLKPTYGDTNLAEYYSRLYGIGQETVDWQAPPSALSRLRPAPNFLTDPRILRRFLGKPPDWDSASRTIDLHARLGGTGADGWYGAMRRDAEARAARLGGLVARRDVAASHAAFMAELGRSKLCFSPFGYGEICWRDIEAMAMGAVLVKPDMSHLLTEPDLYRDGETYLAVRWDFADLEERIRDILSDDGRRKAMARAAWERARGYLASDGPVRAYADVFAAAPAAPQGPAGRDPVIAA